MIENPIPWPNGARCAVAFTFDMDAESLIHIYLGRTAPNRVTMSSVLRYGPEVAVPRIVSVFKDFGLHQTFFVPGWCIERYPRAISLLIENEHEIAHHGYIHEKPNQMTKDEERRYLHRAIESIVSATGERPRGYRAPSYAFSKHTLDFLIEENFEYDASLMGHDIPYLISNGRREIIELPSDFTMDDWNHFVCIKDFGNVLPIKSPEQGFEVYQAEFDSAWRHGGLWIAVWHPFVSGRASRCDAMVGLIEYMMSKGNVWFARLDEIAAHAHECRKNGCWRPRIDDLPYIDEPFTDLPKQEGVRT